jgi:predicted CXXCH cytochrome family protein
MKKIILTAAAVVMVASSAMAATIAANWETGAAGKSHSITNTKHNIPQKFTGSRAGGNKYDQICIFCHTPHNANVAVPLWNRNLQNNLTNYYNSPTLTSVAKAAGVVGTSTISAFCMACHDGATAMGDIKYGADTGINATTYNNHAGDDNARANLGTDMSNDHPVGFSYVAAQAVVESDGAASRLNPVTQAAKTLGNFLFSKAGASNPTEMECASCHKVHDSYYPPFLRTTNEYSKLCLACHNK